MMGTGPGCIHSVVSTDSNTPVCVEMMGTGPEWIHSVVSTDSDARVSGSHNLGLVRNTMSITYFVIGRNTMSITYFVIGPEYHEYHISRDCVILCNRF